MNENIRVGQEVETFLAECRQFVPQYGGYDWSTEFDFAEGRVNIRYFLRGRDVGGANFAFPAPLVTRFVEGEETFFFPYERVECSACGKQAEAESMENIGQESFCPTCTSLMLHGRIP